MIHVKAEFTSPEQFDSPMPPWRLTISDRLVQTFGAWAMNDIGVNAPVVPRVLPEAELAALPVDQEQGLPSKLGWDFETLLGQTQGFRSTEQDLPAVGAWILTRLVQYKTNPAMSPNGFPIGTTPLHEFLTQTAWSRLNVPGVGYQDSIQPFPEEGEELPPATLYASPKTMFKDDAKNQPAFSITLMDAMIEHDPRAILEGLRDVDDVDHNARRLLGNAATPASCNALINAMTIWTFQALPKARDQRAALFKSTVTALPIALAVAQPLMGHPAMTDILIGWSQQLTGTEGIDHLGAWRSVLDTQIKASQDLATTHDSSPNAALPNPGKGAAAQALSAVDQPLSVLIEQAKGFVKTYQQNVRRLAQEAVEAQKAQRHRLKELEQRLREERDQTAQQQAQNKAQREHQKTIEEANAPLKVSASPLRRFGLDDLDRWKAGQAPSAGRVAASSHWGERQAFDDLDDPDMMEERQETLPLSAASALLGTSVPRRRRP